MLTLDVAISTYRPDGIYRVERMLLPPKEGIRYIISWQDHEDMPVPETLKKRDDVEVYKLNLKGLSNNRNNALMHCQGDIVLIADDDLIYKKDFSDLIISSFENNPEIDLAVFKINFHSPKKYPSTDCRLRLPLPKNYYCSSVEIAFRRKKLSRIRFWEKMGLGNEILGCGEDELFLITAIKKGYNCWFINKFIADHPNLTSGSSLSDKVLRGQGFICGILYPWTSILRLPLKTYRIYKKQKNNYIRTLKYLSEGYLLSITKRREIPDIGKS